MRGLVVWDLELCIPSILFCNVQLKMVVMNEIAINCLHPVRLLQFADCNHVS